MTPSILHVIVQQILHFLNLWGLTYGSELSLCSEAVLAMLQVVLKALLQDRKAAETTKQAKAAKLSFSVRAWARLKALILLILLLYTIPGVPCRAAPCKPASCIFI